MEVNKINMFNQRNFVLNTWPCFGAQLYTTNCLLRYYKMKTGDTALYKNFVKELSQKLNPLPDKPIMLTLSENAVRNINCGRLPHEPAAVICIGRPLMGGAEYIGSKKIPIDITSNPQKAVQRVFETAKDLILHADYKK